MTQLEKSQEPILPITIVPLDGAKQQRSPSTKDAPADMRHWQIDEFLRQKGLADNTQRAYKRQLKNFSAWCNKSWLNVTPSDIGKYRRELKQQELKPASINHALNTLRAFYQWMRRSNEYPVNQPLPTDAIGLERVEEPQDLHIDKEDLADIWHALSMEGATRIRDRAIVALLSHGLRASELSMLNINSWNGEQLAFRRSKGQNVSVAFPQQGGKATLKSLFSVATAGRWSIYANAR